MMRLELRDLVFGPSVESIALDRAQLDVPRRVRAQIAALDRELTERAQRCEPTACGMRWLLVEYRFDPYRRQQLERPVAIDRTEALKDAAPHPLRARAFRGEELLRVEILGDDCGHAAGLDAARTDGGARAGERDLIGCHELDRTRQARQRHEPITAPPKIAMDAALAINPRLHVFQPNPTHCLITLRSASHGLLASVGASPKCSTVPSGMVMLVTVLPAFSAAAIILRMLGLRGVATRRPARHFRKSIAFAHAVICSGFVRGAKSAASNTCSIWSVTRQLRGAPRRWRGRPPACRS